MAMASMYGWSTETSRDCRSSSKIGARASADRGLPAPSHSHSRAMSRASSPCSRFKIDVVETVKHGYEGYLRMLSLVAGITTKPTKRRICLGPDNCSSPLSPDILLMPNAIARSCPIALDFRRESRILVQVINLLVDAVLLSAFYVSVLDLRASSTIGAACGATTR